jgi:hypothetical protein
MASPVAGGEPVHQRPPVVVEMQFVVTGGSLQNPVVVTGTQVVEGRTFFEVVKTDAVTARLLQGTVVKGKRPVCSTIVVADLSRLSVQAYNAMQAAEQQHEDLGVDAEDTEIRKKKKVKSAAEMKVVTIAGPAYGQRCPAAELRAACNGHARQLWMELTPSSIAYLQSAVDAQLSAVREGSFEEHAAASGGRLPTDLPNCKYDVARKSYVVVYKDAEGKRRHKFFYIKNGIKEDVMSAAFAFAQEHA